MKAAYFTDRNRFLVALSKPIYAVGHALQKLAFRIRCKQSTKTEEFNVGIRHGFDFEPGMMIVVSTDTGEEPDRSLN